MKVMLVFLAVSFVLGVRTASNQRVANGRVPGRQVLLAMAVVVSVALLSHRLA